MSEGRRDPYRAGFEPARRRVLITGAGGRIGRHLAGSLPDRYDLRLHYFRTAPDPVSGAELVQADIAEYDQIAPALVGIDAVVHLAAEPSPHADWETIHRDNIVGARNVFEAAHAAGVRRVVFASTNHVMGMYDRDQQWPVFSPQPVRPDSLYGVSKAFGETLGRYYYDQYGLSVICLRIGWFLPEPKDEFARWTWLSPRDCTQIVEKAIEADLGYGVFYAISANGRRRWDLTETMVRLGYEPVDDAERFFADGGIVPSVGV